MEMTFKIKVASQIHGEKMDYSISDGDIKHFLDRLYIYSRINFSYIKDLNINTKKHKNTKTEMGDEEGLAMTQNLEATK